ncbi:MAG: TetR family transcriptional regulator [Rubrivivax sp.]|nr:TetR family transcriptional regulator [Rubrivivax sp.]
MWRRIPAPPATGFYLAAIAAGPAPPPSTRYSSTAQQQIGQCGAARLGGGLRLFLLHGVSGTSLHDIALAAGVTRGAVHWHFKDKATSSTP